MPYIIFGRITTLGMDVYVSMVGELYILIPQLTVSSRRGPEDDVVSQVQILSGTFGIIFGSPGNATRVHECTIYIHTRIYGMCVGYCRARASVQSVKLDGSDCYNYKHSSVACLPLRGRPPPDVEIPLERRLAPPAFVLHIIYARRRERGRDPLYRGFERGRQQSRRRHVVFARAVRAALFFGVAFSATAHARGRSCTGGYTQLSCTGHLFKKILILRIQPSI